jgi:hypothetical protein
MFGFLGRMSQANKVLEEKLADLNTPLEQILGQEDVNNHVAMNNEASS